MEGNSQWTRWLLAAASGMVLSSTEGPTGQEVFTVGRSGDPTPLQAAIDAASDGDVLLVTPGDYEPVVLEGKSLNISVDGIGEIRIHSDGSRPAVEVRGLEPDDNVVLFGFTLTWSGAGARVPALWLHGNEGAVHLHDLQVRSVGPAVGARVQAPVFFANNAGRIWITDVFVNHPEPQVGSSVARYRLGSEDDGLAALLLSESEVVVHRGWINGFDAAERGRGHGGAAVRTFGSASLLLRNDAAGPGLVLAGGDDGAVGGDVIQKIDPGRVVLERCGRSWTWPGRGASIDGGVHAVEDDHGVVSVAGGGEQIRDLPGCRAERFGSLEVTVTGAVPGDLSGLRIRTDAARDYVVFASLKLRSGSFDVPGLAGQLMIDLDHAFPVAAGHLGDPPFNQQLYPLPVPGDASVRGRMLAFQPVFLPEVGRQEILLGAGDFTTIGF